MHTRIHAYVQGRYCYALQQEMIIGVTASQPGALTHGGWGDMASNIWMTRPRRFPNPGCLASRRLQKQMTGCQDDWLPLSPRHCLVGWPSLNVLDVWHWRYRCSFSQSQLYFKSWIIVIIIITILKIKCIKCWFEWRIWKDSWFGSLSSINNNICLFWNP